MYSLNMTDLRHTEFEMFALFEMTPDLVCIAGKDGYFKKINPAVIEKLCYTEEELFARPIASFIHPEDVDRTGRERAKLLSGKTLLNFQNRYVKKNGDDVWLEWTSIYVPHKEIVFAIAKDITERKKSEKEIEEKYKKYKGLATHFKSTLEKDKKYLAVELHEELAQLASVVKMDVHWLSNNIPLLSGVAKKRMEQALVITGLLINTIRRISFSISPGMLDDIGLDATLEWHCKEFSILNGIPCHFESKYDETKLTQEIKIDFFRICQEALTNVMYHAEASNVIISIEELGDKLSLCIEDDGKGFDLHKQHPATGLIRIRERTASINGHLVIQSDTGKGTKICVTITK